MSQSLREQTGTDRIRTQPSPPGSRRRRLTAMILAFGLLLGAAAGWAAFMMLGEASTGTTAQTGTSEAEQWRRAKAAERSADLAGTRSQEADRLRWETLADEYAPGWRDR